MEPSYGAPAGLILIGSALAASILPRQWWPSATIVGLCVIASEYYRTRGADLHLAAVAAFILFLAGVGIGAVTGTRFLLHAR